MLSFILRSGATVKSINSVPRASFTSSSSSLVASFTDTSTDSGGNIVTRLWTFGDSTTSSAVNPVHTYASGGTYSVTLLITDNNGKTSSITHSITVAASSVTSSFTTTISNLIVTFTDTSTVSGATISSWSWNFGDGNTSMIQNPVHTYSTAGSYTISLQVTDSNGDTNTSSQSITVTAASTGLTLAAHPRLILDAPTLTSLRTEYTNNSTLYQNLKTYCDTWVGGTVSVPTGPAYPNAPSFGQGYEGQAYVQPILSCALLYKILAGPNPTLAAQYGTVAVNGVMAASTLGANAEPPSTDAGYAIRNYGLVFGLVYDWCYELLSSAQKTQIWTCANNWIAYWEANKADGSGSGGTFEFVGNPIGNYFAGYFHAKTVMNLAMYEENPSAPAQWLDLINTEFGTRIQPYYQRHMTGGGWPEGFGNYGPLALFNMSMPALEIYTATGEDIIGNGSFTYPLDNGNYIMHGTWPDFTHIDGHDTTHSTGNPTPLPNLSQPSTIAQVGYFLDRYNASNAPVFRQFAANVHAVVDSMGASQSPPYQAILFKQTGTSTAPMNTLPLSYHATGLGMVFSRSGWSTTDKWMSFRAAPYANNPNVGEEGFDQGTVICVNGGKPLLVNTYSWIVQEPGGNVDENLVYNDLTGTFNGNMFSGNSQCYNIYYVADMTGSTLNQRFGQASYTWENDGVTTAMVMDDLTTHIYAKATNLEQMYIPLTAGIPVASWKRELVQVRPDQIVVCDHTAKQTATFTEWMAWHVPALPVLSTGLPTGQVQYKVTYNSTYVGAVTQILPPSPTTSIVPLYPTSTTTKVWQIKNVNPGSTAAHTWLTVLDMASSPVTYTNLNGVNCTAVHLANTPGDVVVFADGGTLSFDQPTTGAHYCVAGLAGNTQYAVNYNGTTVSIAPGTGYLSSTNGAITFDIGIGTFSINGTLPAGNVGVPYSGTLTLSGAYTQPVSLSGNPPAWMTVTLNGITITCTGTPTTETTISYTPIVTDSTSGTPLTASSTQSIVIGAAPPMTVSGTLGNGYAGFPYSATLTLGGVFTPPVTLGAAAGSVPTWMTSNLSGNVLTLSGTPTAAEIDTFVPQITDSTSGTPQTAVTGSQTINITTAPAFTLTGTLGAGLAGTAYSQTLTLGGAFTPPVTMGLQSGTLPSWMSVAVSGNTVTYSGTPSAGATAVTFVPTATDSTSVPRVAVGSSQSVAVSSAPTSYWNPNNTNTCITIGNGAATNSLATYTTGATTQGQTVNTKSFTGIVYVEAILTVAATPAFGAGIGWATTDPDTVSSNNRAGDTYDEAAIYAPGGALNSSYTLYNLSLTPVSPGVYRIGMLIDTATRKWWATCDGTNWLPDVNGNVGNPATGLNTLPMPTVGNSIGYIVGTTTVAADSVELVTDPTNMLWTSIVPSGIGAVIGILA